MLDWFQLRHSTLNLFSPSESSYFWLVETKLQKCQLHCCGVFTVNERQSSTKQFYKNEIPIKEFIPSFLLKMNPCIGFLSFFAPVAEHLFCRTSRRLLLKQTDENYKTYLTHLQPMFHLNPLIPTENIRKSKVF